MKPSIEIEALCKKLHPIIGAEADKLWRMYLSEDELGRRDLAIDIEILAEKLLGKEDMEDQEILLSPPTEQEAQGHFILGNVIYNQKKLHPLFLKKEDFVRQVGIFAMTGEGKTNLAHLLASQLLKAKIPFLVIDWKRSWRNLLSLRDQIPELKNVQVFTVGRDILPFHWNPFRAPPGANQEQWVGVISEALERSHLSGPGVAHHFNMIYSKLTSTISEDFYPTFQDGLKEIEKIQTTMRELMWKQTAMRIFHSFTVGEAFKVYNARNPIRLETLLLKPVILELDLELPKPLRVFFSEMILRWIHLFRLNQGETGDVRHVLFLEEAHNLFQEPSFTHVASSIENVYREIRAFGQGIVSITQHPSQLPVYLLGNCHTQIYLGLQHAEDIKAAWQSLFLNLDERSYPNRLKVGECIVKIKNRIEPCLIKTPLVPIEKGLITDSWLKENTPAYLSLNSDGKNDRSPRYFPPHNNGGKNGKKPNGSKNPHDRLLIDIFEHPFSGITRRYKRLGFNPKYGNKYKNQLIGQGCIQPRKIITNKGWITLFDLTKKGRMVLRDLGFAGKVWNEGIVHKFWNHKVARHYEKQGYKVEVEQYYVNGRPDIILTDKATGKKTAVEIETGKSNAIGNIKRALKAGFDQVICLATSQSVQAKIIEKLKREGILEYREKILSATDIMTNGHSDFSHKNPA